MATTEQQAQPELKRVMGPGLLLLFIVGDVLGTGIYALTGQVAARARVASTRSTRHHRRSHSGQRRSHTGTT